MPVVAVPAWPLGTAGTIVASGWSIGLKTPPFARKPWLVVPAAAGGGSADTGAAASASRYRQQRGGGERG